MDADRIRSWLQPKWPGLYWIARPLWRWVNHFVSLNRYWKERKDLNYYEEVMRLARSHVPLGRYVIDVGSHNTEILMSLEDFELRVALDLDFPPHRRGIQSVRMDFMEYGPDVYFDLVLCLQVLEHLDDPEAFSRRLLRTGKTVIVSVPYKWPEGACATHRQDPIDEEKLTSWFKRKPVETRIVANGAKRLIAVYKS